MFADRHLPKWRPTKVEKSRPRIIALLNEVHFSIALKNFKFVLHDTKQNVTTQN